MIAETSCHTKTDLALRVHSGVWRVHKRLKSPKFSESGIVHVTSVWLRFKATENTPDIRAITPIPNPSTRESVIVCGTDIEMVNNSYLPSSSWTSWLLSPRNSFLLASEILGDLLT